MCGYAMIRYGEEGRLMYASRGTATFDDIAIALHDISLAVRLAAISHPSVDEDHISLAIRVGCPELLKKALAHPKATPEHLSGSRKKLLDDTTTREQTRVVERQAALT